MSSGKIHFDGEQGTCWLITPSRVITAAHCVGAIGTEAVVDFSGTSVTAKVLDRAEDLDAAVLEIPSLANSPPPLAVCERPRDENAKSQWSSFGFPGVLSEHVLGLTLGGAIRNFRAGRKVAGDALQLQCDEGGLPHLPDLDDHGDQVQVFSGMSGAAVRAGGTAGPVVGLWLQSPTVLHGVAIFVSPMEDVVTRFRSHLFEVAIRPWDDRPFLDIRRLSDGTCRVAAQPSLAEIASAWNGSQPLRIACDFPTGEVRALQTALLRLVLHTPNIAALEFPNPADWRSAAVQAGRNGMPINDFIAATVIDPLPWSALATPAPPEAMTTDITPEAVARAIHSSCNHWTLGRLASEIDRVLAEEHTQELIRFHIADDLREPMRELWDQWRPILAGDPAFLGHFLTLMLTEEGDFDVTKRALIAVGPRTLSICLVRLLAYTLAVNCCLPKPFQPSGVLPGNLEHAEHAGHACGIEIYQKQRLHLTIDSCQWRTPIVLIPHLYQDSSVMRAAALPLNVQPGAPTSALSSAPPRTWLLTGAKELHDAMSASRAALTDLLRQQSEEFYTLQKRYLPPVPTT